jgi:hypothetical protein
MLKLYCYVDETWQRYADFFLVVVVILTSERESLAQVLEKLEESTGKHRSKWTRSADDARQEYIQAVLEDSRFKGVFHYQVYRSTQDYVDHTICTIAQAIALRVLDVEDYKATIMIDGLQKSQQQMVGAALRKRGIRTRKIRGATDEGDPFIRLADAMCGFLADCYTGREDSKTLFEMAKRDGVILEV